MLPNCFVMGAAKCGTSTLHEHLRVHPEVFMTKLKEPHFFISDKSWGNWAKGIAWYEALFEEGVGRKVRGESSVGYSHDLYAEMCCEKMRSLVPDAKIIYMTRNPIKRMQSHYLMEYYDPNPAIDG